MDETAAPNLIETMTRATRGEKQAIAVIYEAYYLPVFRFVLKKIQNKSEAEDIAQGVFIKLYNSRVQYVHQNRSPLAYLFTIAKNLLIDEIRKKNRRPTAELVENVNDGKSLEGESAIKMDVWEGLAELAETERRVLVMKFVEGFDTNEIAAALNTTTDNVRQLQCRALKKLRAKII